MRHLVLCAALLPMLAAESSPEQPPKGIPVADLQAADTDGDGFISREEMKTFMEAHRPARPEGERGKGEKGGPGYAGPGPSIQAFEAADKDGDGILSGQELRALHKALREERGGKGPGEDREQRNDDDQEKGDGRRGESREGKGPGKDFPGISLDAIRGADADGDGHISREEMQSVMPKPKECPNQQCPNKQDS